MKLMLALLNGLFIVPAILAAPHARTKRGEKPVGKVDPETASDCTYWEEKTDASVTCDSLQAAWSISANDFRKWNPLVKDDCSGMKIGNSYCVEVNFGLPRSTTTQPTTVPSTTSTGNGVTTPTPTQPNMVDNCNKFYFVKEDESCADIASANGINVDDFGKWNPKVGAQCTGLWAKTYACVGVLGSTGSPTDVPSTTTTTGNGVVTPTPTQPGMVDNCNKFYLVKEGDGCADIITNNGISMEDFAKWNPRVGPRCTGLWAKTYTCVGILGSQTDKPTAPPNAVKTPSPIQPDMINSCNRFHFVESGQSCQDIASRYGVTVSELTNWNPKAGSDCSRIFGQTWACVDPIRSFSFDDGTKNQWIVAEGGADTSSKALAMTSFGNKAYYDVNFNDVAFEARMTLRAGRSGNAGIMFRASDIGKGGDQYHGYYAGVNLAGDLVLGRVNNDWRELGRAKVGVSADRPFTIKALATGDQIAVYVNNVDRPALTVRDGTFRSGKVGVRTYETEAVFDDLSVSTVVFDDFERNLINWQIYDGGFDARTRELVASDVTSGKIAYQATFEDFVLEADVALTHSGDNRNAGFLFRTTDVGNGPDAYKGYYVGIDASSRVILGRAGGGWKQLDQNKVGIRVNQKYRLRVRAIGNSINVWVDGNPYIQYRDSTYKKGMAGVRVYSTGAVVDNFTIQKI
ncbi:uncharacterized protein TrAFT101_004030 [Trichoderma asperellum]|uniref:uncharacterized protein n=1 Tax=Trichoderma asperellum TaxID=101201 RepID=UPI00331AD9AC|nr:hypothetical protein TrAFT101_004030 [Trichoderma asperellum]